LNYSAVVLSGSGFISHWPWIHGPLLGDVWEEALGDLRCAGRGCNSDKSERCLMPGPLVNWWNRGSPSCGTELSVFRGSWRPWGAGPGQARSICGCYSPLVMVSNRSEIRASRSLPNGEDEGKITEGRRLKESTTKPEQGRSQLESGDGRREH
jgi:hypothetical protein